MKTHVSHKFLDAQKNSCDFDSTDHMIGQLDSISNFVLVVLKCLLSSKHFGLITYQNCLTQLLT